MYGHRYDKVTLSPLLLQRGLRFGPIQRTYEDSHDGRSLSIYGSKCQIWRTFTTMLTAIDPNKDISKTRQVHVK
jgi:hypothetical protein